MNTQDKIRTAFERSARALTLRPSLGQGTGVSRTRVRQGLTCDIEDGPWKLTAALDGAPPAGAPGPAPGVYGRAALGSCLAIGYVQWAARCGVPLSGLEVEVQADYDARGPYGLADVPCGYTQVRYTVIIESPAPEADILRMLDVADAHSPYLDVFARAQDLHRQIRIVKKQE